MYLQKLYVQVDTYLGQTFKALPVSSNKPDRFNFRSWRNIICLNDSWMRVYLSKHRIQTNGVPEYTRFPTMSHAYIKCLGNTLISHVSLIERQFVKTIFWSKVDFVFWSDNFCPALVHYPHFNDKLNTTSHKHARKTLFKTGFSNNTVRHGHENIGKNPNMLNITQILPLEYPFSNPNIWSCKHLSA